MRQGWEEWEEWEEWESWAPQAPLPGAFGDGLARWVAEGQQDALCAIGAGLVQFLERPPERLRSKVLRPSRRLRGPFSALEPVQKCRDVDEARAGIHEI